MSALFNQNRVWPYWSFLEFRNDWRDLFEISSTLWNHPRTPILESSPSWCQGSMKLLILNGFKLWKGKIYVFDIWCHDDLNILNLIFLFLLWFPFVFMFEQTKCVIRSVYSLQIYKHSNLHSKYGSNWANIKLNQRILKLREFSSRKNAESCGLYGANWGCF